MSLKLRNALIGLGIAVVAVFLCYSCVAGNYNTLVSIEEEVDSQWAQVENQYQRRFDLIPNLVATVKKYAQHESDVYVQVSEARAKAGGVTKIDSELLNDPEKLDQYQKAQDSLGGALQRLLSITENYPELKADKNFLALQDELEGTENRISIERKRYNDAARRFNTKIRQFPTVLMANNWGFKSKAYFTAAENAKTAPKVEF
ncbi:MAG: LemA family protein [Treponema sp.]|nr:LemA family protein [Treponema sp.]